MTTSETASPDEPVDAVAALFGDQAERARSFWRHLATTAVERGLMGPREVPRLWHRHILNCVVLGELIPSGSTLADVGSGAGLPGLALAIARPDLTVTLVEPLQRRVTWLADVVTDLDLGNVVIRRARAEELRGELRVDVATARAVAALPVLASWCLPLVRPGGHLLALKGQTAAAELEASEVALKALGAREWSLRTVGGGVLDEISTVIDVVAGDVAQDRSRAPGRRRMRSASALREERASRERAAGTGSPSAPGGAGSSDSAGSRGAGTGNRNRRRRRG